MVALVSVLAAILLPLLFRVRESCYQASCASNLRRLGEAFQLYANDWNGSWPSPGGLVGDRTYWSQSGFGGLNIYVKQQGVGSVWCCPLLTEWHGKYPARTYSMNSYLRTPADVDYPTCIGILKGIDTGKIPAPQATVLLFEAVPLSAAYQNTAYSEDQIYYIYRCANWSWARGFYANIAHAIQPGKPWHGKKNNYLYCDGHIVARPPGPKTTGTWSTYEEMSEWYVDKAAFGRKFAHLRN